ncbi:phage baseplate assembly protein V [Chromohalobacter nigrandesensis]|uniref:phage baseplate assembly protein V n=1 Tax=Chromohalobacter nigrandesensis TaxID=119863 RepID=UPI001FF1AE92|nr:phage baseplate assembly protein V [Chromohalobacter nigrandesensis]
MNQAWRLQELERRLNNLLMVGTILEVDHAARKLKVKVGEIRTAWLNWPTEMGRNYRRWRPLRKGQQVVLSSPSGDPAQAVITGMLYSSALPSPSDNPDLDLIEFEDGTRFQYDSADHVIKIHCVGDIVVENAKSITVNTGTTLDITAGGDATLKAPTVTVDSPQSTFTGAVTIQGPLTYQGGMTGSGGSGAAASISGGVRVTDGDITADDISVKYHDHDGDSGGKTSRPNPS